MDCIWFVYIILVVLLWAATGLIYKAGIHKEPEDHTAVKYSVSVGVVFFFISVVYLVIRDEPFSIFESAVRYWPMTLFGIVYPIINTVSFNGYIYNEVTVESPLEGISGGTSTILLITTYLILGRVDSISTLLTPLRTTGMIVILFSIILLAYSRNREGRRKEKSDADGGRTSWKWVGLGTLIFPILFAMVDSMETVVSGICLDSTFGYSMPEGDSIILVGMEYSIFSLGCWIYLLIKEREVYHPLKKENLPRLLGSVTDNIGIVFYSYAMAIDSISTDPVLAVYPVLSMIGGRIFMKEKVSFSQYVSVLLIVVGSILVVADTVI
ncbi:MAG: EamA family transporter [Lachnospiraceae bacterium]|nr:EamA family transporter [Lachnospiraceae bacterium]